MLCKFNGWALLAALLYLGQAQIQGVSSRWQPLLSQCSPQSEQAATSSLYEEVLALLQYWLYSKVKEVFNCL